MQEPRREALIRRILAGKVDVTEAALLLGLSERQVWRRRARFLAGAGGLAHGNRGRSPVDRIDPALAARVVAFAQDGYAGINDSPDVVSRTSSRDASSIVRDAQAQIQLLTGQPTGRREVTVRYVEPGALREMARTLHVERLTAIEPGQRERSKD